MSIYATLDGEIGDQLASNSGWGEFCRWVETLEDAPQLRCLTEYGWSDDLEEVTDQLEDSVSLYLEDEDVISVGEQLLEVLQGRGDAEVMTITNGVTDGDEDDGEEPTDNNFDSGEQRDATGKWMKGGGGGGSGDVNPLFTRPLVPPKRSGTTPSVGVNPLFTGGSVTKQTVRQALTPTTPAATASGPPTQPLVPTFLPRQGGVPKWRPVVGVTPAAVEPTSAQSLPAEVPATPSAPTPRTGTVATGGQQPQKALPRWKPIMDHPTGHEVQGGTPTPTPATAASQAAPSLGRTQRSGVDQLKDLLASIPDIPLAMRRELGSVIDEVGRQLTPEALQRMQQRLERLRGVTGNQWVTLGDDSKNPGQRVWIGDDGGFHPGGPPKVAEAKKSSSRTKREAKKAAGSVTTLAEFKQRLNQIAEEGRSEYQAAHEMVLRSATEDGDVQVGGMSRPMRMMEMRVDGILFRYERDDKFTTSGQSNMWLSNPGKSLASSLRSLTFGETQIPETLKSHVKEVTFTSQRNSKDDYWAQRYGMPGFRAKATGGDSHVEVYNGGEIQPGTFAHEAGHCLAKDLWDAYEPPYDHPYAVAQRAEPPVSNYGSKSNSEDFAEACMLYTVDRERLKRQFPLKYQALHELLKD